MYMYTHHVQCMKSRLVYMCIACTVQCVQCTCVLHVQCSVYSVHVYCMYSAVCTVYMCIACTVQCVLHVQCSVYVY